MCLQAFFLIFVANYIEWDVIYKTMKDILLEKYRCAEISATVVIMPSYDGKQLIGRSTYVYRRESIFYRTDKTIKYTISTSTI